MHHPDECLRSTVDGRCDSVSLNTCSAALDVQTCSGHSTFSYCSTSLHTVVQVGTTDEQRVFESLIVGSL